MVATPNSLTEEPRINIHKNARTTARVSQIGAWASKQSQALIGRFELEARVAKFAAKFHLGTAPGRHTGQAAG